MSKIIKRLNKNFTILDNRVLQCKELDLLAKGLYAYLVSLPEDWSFAIERIARANNTTEGKVKKAIEQLEEAGFLEREYTLNADGKRGVKADYILYDFDTKASEKNLSRTQISTPQNLGVEKVGVAYKYNKEPIEKENNYQSPEFFNKNSAPKGDGVSLPQSQIDFFDLDGNDLIGEAEFENPKPSASRPKKESEYSQEFETFWSEYPIKTNKKSAYKAFKAALKSKTSLGVILDTLKDFKAFLEASKAKKQFIPHASTWLNQERWENDYKAELESLKAEAQKDEWKRPEWYDWG